jgi:hypothetical protein
MDSILRLHDFGDIPDSGVAFGRTYHRAVKIRETKTALTLGELIESGYVACGKRRTRGIILLAAKARLIVFQGTPQVYDLLNGNV